MFRNRQNTQKPDEELIQKFQRTFSDLVPPASHRNDLRLGQMPGVGPITPARLNMGNDMKLNEPTHRAAHDMRYAPPYVDPNTVSFVNPLQPPGYYTPNSGGLGAVYHSQAGDLHTPNMNMSMMTPLSLPQQISAATINADAVTMGLEQFDQHYLPPHFNNPHPFAQQASFAPSAFMQSDTGYDAMDESGEELSLNDVDMQGHSSNLIASTIQDDQMSLQNPGETFRYHVTLRAPTAMINHQAEIPVTYLNKGQAYSLSVIDSTPPPRTGQPLKYRTFVRVSFQEEEQRAKPAACWQLWKEGRGSNEAHQRGGKLQAVEYVDPIQGGAEDAKNRQIQIESSSFDGFCVTWTVNPSTGASDCAIPVRFNFLSTDFSHSKGVKGIPVRLCAKTELVSPDEMSPTSSKESEVCYCKVKLFRDHGAERKLSNDVAHVKKTIEKLRQQIAQAEMGAGNYYGKRKRSGGSIALKGADPRPAKISKHKRTWSMGSQDGPGKMSLEDDLHAKLALMQDMFTSTRPVSILALRGDEPDDPDSFPVVLPESREFIKRENSRGSRFSLEGAVASPGSSTMSINSPTHPTNTQPNIFYDSAYQGSLSTSRENSRPCSETLSEKMVLKHPVKVNRVGSSNSQAPMGFLEAVDIDPTYRPPADRPVKPIACFYLRFPRNDQPQEDYYRAVYLTERTVRDLMEKISVKQRIDPQRIVRVLRVKQNGLKIMVDDDVVRELPDGQDMVVEISETSSLESAGAANLSSAVEVKLSY
ncbi:hypothetical protein BO71DRAFT_431129 [Aspergillus ellipticus CBS 707.79]|uniref:Grh/CP2 DB domain-containing protein n=1 Tax=Aspergillus ellipticus CBS 707.79 TaxID=1448320 RepID=A0A319D7N1_9EURO|nr:hypothetical protein BO71DRAFT_431129 [Aspergillus ellipticus CBS 707.79]